MFHSNVVGAAVGRAANFHGQPPIRPGAAYPAARVIPDGGRDCEPDICAELHNHDASSRNSVRREVHRVPRIREHDTLSAASRQQPRRRPAEGLHDGERRVHPVQPLGVQTRIEKHGEH